MAAQTDARIAVIGSSNVDFIMRLERLPSVGETVTDGTFMQSFGGKGANQAVAAARAGGRVTFVTGLGDDVYAPLMLDNFRRDGIQTDHVLVQTGMATGCALILFDRQGQNCIAVSPGANYALEPTHINACAAVIRQARMLVMQMELSVPTALRALMIAAENGTPTLFNYAPVRGDIPLSAHIHVLVVNEHEAAALTGLPVETVEQAARAAQALRAQGPRIVVLTLGALGAYVASAEVERHCPAFAVTPVDTTAAGDVFCGALAVALVEDRPLVEAVRFANAASALSVTHLGAQPSIPTRDAINALLGQADAPV
jgi:ribokinase